MAENIVHQKLTNLYWMYRYFNYDATTPCVLQISLTISRTWTRMGFWSSATRYKSEYAIWYHRIFSASILYIIKTRCQLEKIPSTHQTDAFFCYFSANNKTRFAASTWNLQGEQWLHIMTHYKHTLDLPCGLSAFEWMIRHGKNSILRRINTRSNQ